MDFSRITPMMNCCREKNAEKNSIFHLFQTQIDETFTDQHDSFKKNSRRKQRAVEKKIDRKSFGNKFMMNSHVEMFHYLDRFNVFKNHCWEKLLSKKKSIFPKSSCDSWHHIKGRLKGWRDTRREECFWKEVKRHVRSSCDYCTLTTHKTLRSMGVFSQQKNFPLPSSGTRLAWWCPRRVPPPFADDEAARLLA